MIKRIAITGPESTGKSWLTKRLAEYYQTVWVPEYARDYINRLDREYVAEDILKIAKGQLELEEQIAQKARKFLFCDTELIVTKVWYEHKYNSCPPWILDRIEDHRYDLYLLCNVDLPWQDDPQREHPHLREYFFDVYYHELQSRNLPFEVVSGQWEQRFKNAVELVGKHF
ncbi:MAG: ATP-binding protein [Bacteroidales bacterium]|nr:ATP-binding protein [Bacteroidales bacterium]